MPEIAIRWLVIGHAALTVLWPAPADASHTASEAYVIENADGDVVGWQTETTTVGPGWSVREVERSMAYSIDGHEPVETRYRSQTRFEEGKLAAYELDQTAAGRTRSYSVAFGEGFARFAGDKGESQPVPDLPLLEPLSISRREPGDYIAFDPARGRFQQVALSYSPEGSASIAAILRAANHPIGATVYPAEGSDAAERLAAILPRFGAPLAMRRLEEGAPLPALTQRTEISHPLLESPYDIASGTRQGHIRYRVYLPEGLAAEIPQTGEQRVTTGETRLRIDVCERCGPGLPTDEAFLEAMRQPSAWLQSAEPAIAGPAKRARRQTASDARLMERLGRLARTRLRDVDFAGHYSAMSAWKRRKGDCTEDAVVLAALARAAGIPALVASGMTYSRDRYHGVRDAFMPHSWVVAFTDGEWRSYDMTQGAFDSTHIALTLGEGDAESVGAAYVIGGLMAWESISEVRPRPEPND